MKSCRIVLLILLSFSCSISVVEAQGQASTTDLSLESSLDQLMTSVYCHCGCVRETIKHCVCGTAQQIEIDFRNRLINGGTVQQIRTDYLARHGTQYSALMPAKGFNIVAYAMPAVIIALLGVIVFITLKLKRRAALAKSSVSTESQGSASADQYEQIEEELERYKRQR